MPKGYFTQLDLDTNEGSFMNNLDLIVWERYKKNKQERPIAQIPLPLAPLPQKKPINNEKDKQKRGVYIFEM
jgi:hypothetical protein|tara:strand:- start:14 stop:229 length:216 start_codon:yes stop_codon:yes gene_type:complete